MAIGVLGFVLTLSAAAAFADPPPEPKAKAKAKPKETPEFLSSQKLDLAVEIQAPKYVVVGKPFTIEVKAHNVGHVALANVSGGLRGSGSTKTASGKPGSFRTKKIEPGRHWIFKQTFIAQSPGPQRVSFAAREGLGWAATGGFVTIEALAAPPPKSGKQPAAVVQGLDVQVGVEDVAPPKPGTPFPVTFWVRNAGDVDLVGVVLAVKAQGGVTLDKTHPSKVSIAKLARGEIRKLTVHGTLAKDADPLKAVMLGSAREKRGWSAAGARLPIHKKP
jgi:hypothetical protein